MSPCRCEIAEDSKCGIDTSGVQSFTITVTPVNDAPTFTLGANQTVVEDSGTHTVAQFASVLSTGPSDETGQTVAYLVTTDNETLFSEAPVLAPDGTLTYTLAANANGVAHVSVQVRDSEGTANGGIDTSGESSFFTITVTPVNDAPTFTLGANQTVVEDSGTHTVAQFASISEHRTLR